MCTYCWPKTTSFILIAGDRGEKTALAQHLEVCGGHCITHFSFCCLAYFLLRCSRPRSRRSSSSTALRTRGEMVTSCLHMLLCWENCGCPFFFKSVFQSFRVVTVKGRLLLHRVRWRQLERKSRSSSNWKAVLVWTYMNGWDLIRHSDPGHLPFTNRRWGQVNRGKFLIRN